MKKQNRPVVIWLFTGCVLLFIMVMVGGITRLTNSGLSMTDWHLVTDTFPPMTDEKWNEAFDEYKKFPEYQKINIHNDFTLSDYKFIYFWEWFHRFIGRIIGIVFIVPFVYFLIKKRLDRATVWKCVVLLAMGAFQGFLGWFMVKSGLIDNPDVSHYRLSLHLTFAFATFAYTLWVALDLMFSERRAAIIPLRNLARITMIVLFIQIIYGGFVAGLNAGLIHNHWPMMSDGQFMHDSVLMEYDGVKNFVEGKSGIQFVHRMMAYAVFGLVVWLFIRTRKLAVEQMQLRMSKEILAMVFIQFALGVFTLLFSVPLWLGLAHQLGAFVLLTLLTIYLHRVTK
ncbi:MAG: COX15/CtaA family protein [Flavobacterium sp.]|nr:COX15/CtaA family protein [Flavobacterium sp.]